MTSVLPVVTVRSPDVAVIPAVPLMRPLAVSEVVEVASSTDEPMMRAPFACTVSISLVVSVEPTIVAPASLTVNLAPLTAMAVVAAAAFTFTEPFVVTTPADVI